MKKIIGMVLFLTGTIFSSFAGDAAVFVDGGFSKDGKVYVFGQYGKTDKTFEGWADIYAVDVKSNDYIDGEVFKIKPSAVTNNKTGKEVYDSLVAQSYYKLKKYNYEKAPADRILYILEDENKSGTDEIVFKDFVSSVSKDQGYYHVQLVSEAKGTGVNVKSSFFIMLEKQDAKGKVLARQKIGTPSIWRKGVKNYKIERIVCDESGKNIVFVVEKTCEDKTGINIRYMIEAATLDNDFFENLSEPENESEVKTDSTINLLEDAKSKLLMLSINLVEFQKK